MVDLRGDENRFVTAITAGTPVLRRARDSLGYDHPSRELGTDPYFDLITVVAPESTYLTVVINQKHTRRVRAGQVATFDKDLLGPILFYTVDAGANLASGDFEIYEAPGTPSRTEYQRAGQI